MCLLISNHQICKAHKNLEDTLMLWISACMHDLKHESGKNATVVETFFGVSKTSLLSQRPLNV